MTSPDTAGLGGEVFVGSVIRLELYQLELKYVDGPTDPMTGHIPTVLFVCVHNAGRSQMAAAFLRRLGGDRMQVLSAGSEPANQLNPVVLEAMAEKGIDLSGERPKLLAESAVRQSDVVVTMGCGDTCPFYPGKRYEDWQLDDPAGQGLVKVREIRDAIEARIGVLASELLGTELSQA
jgi:protein-tyrosine-phosphatase